MNILEFAKKFCQDILDEATCRQNLLEFEGFPYDNLLKEDDGTYVKVVSTNSYDIPLEDILSMPREDFQRVWPHQECMQAYDNYVSNLIVLDGEENLKHVRNELRREQERIAAFDTIPEAFR